MSKNTKLTDIAPCGMNCRLCIGYIREKNRCDGCLTPNSKCGKKCRIRFCTARKGKYCDHTCPTYPCTRLKSLDERYQKKYGMSMLENLQMIEERGIQKFVRNENQRWRCLSCGELICVHRSHCLACGSTREE